MPLIIIIIIIIIIIYSIQAMQPGSSVD